ncbi:MAG: flavodoxin domain-containing protein [Spirochaetes bacterium]|nr:flavodoxin domain-containing protein [Spirochaetota bacterium]
MTLIAYGTRYGSTEECFDIMINELKDKNVKIINLKTAKEKVNINDYDKIIIGGPINAGRLNKYVRKFVEKNLQTLLNKKIGLFITHLEPVESAFKYFETNYPSKLLDKALVKSCFGGALYFERLSVLERPILKMITKSSANINQINKENIINFAKKINNA